MKSPFNVIANKKGTNKWFICEVKGRSSSCLLNELLKDENFLKIYDKYELKSQYFDYYILNLINKNNNEKRQLD